MVVIEEEEEKRVERWREKVREMYQKLEEERPLELEVNPREEMERRKTLFYVSDDEKIFHTEQWWKALSKNDVTCRVVWEEEKKRAKRCEERWKEEVRTAFRKLEEERPLELETDPHEEVETRYKLYQVPFGGSEWPELKHKNDVAREVVMEEQVRRERDYMKKWEEEVREVYLREKEAGVALTVYALDLEGLRRMGPWGQLVARRKSKLARQVRNEEELREERAPYLLLEEGKREEEERCVREAYLKLERENPLSLQRKRGLARRERLAVYRVNLDGSRLSDWERYVVYRKTIALRRITLEEEAKRGRCREVWEKEEMGEPVQKCPHPLVYDKFLWDTEPGVHVVVRTVDMQIAL